MEAMVVGALLEARKKRRGCGVHSCEKKKSILKFEMNNASAVSALGAYFASGPSRLNRMERFLKSMR